MGRFYRTHDIASPKSQPVRVSNDQVLEADWIQLFLLLWKASLLIFGNFEDVAESKATLRGPTDDDEDEHKESFITTSPLDYHLFRQEITSKYPAYCPPQPLVPIEIENNSILPPLPNHVSRHASVDNIHNLVGSHPKNGSILNQPVHIATPAPSPPPSPAGPGGKGGKKQNYQTNQNFPFLYPPIDNTKQSTGIKGKNEQWDSIVGTTWEDRDVPASILEAGQLFASRMRMSRSLQQMWDVREQFIKAERGWDSPIMSGESDPGGEEYFTADIEGVDSTEDQAHASQHADVPAAPEPETTNDDVQRRLKAVDEFYVNMLPSPCRTF